jgi:outer membrane protein OmpA-like peptidoglycan-associated protein
MKKTFFSISLILMIAIGGQATAQSASNFATKKSTANKKDNAKDEKADKPAKKGADKSIKNKDAMFADKNKAWIVGLHVGYPLVIGDVPPQFGIAYGLNIQKALGYSFALRAHYITGYSTGLAYQGNSWQSLERNNAVNGVNNPVADYFHNQKGIYSNYKMSFNKLSLDGVFYLNNINFNTENQKFLLYAVAGIGAFLYDTKVDQLDANGKMYDYSKVTGDNYDKSSTTYSQLKSMLDGTYETEADRSNGPKLFGQNLLPFVSAGLGGLYKISERVSLSLEATYGFVGNDALDGQRWYAADVPSSNQDAFSYINLGLNIRLGKTENISWYSNPLSLPYKTLMDNKKKLEKVDKLERQVADMGKKMDTAMANIDSLLKDTDGDGVADYFDKEDSTPAGAVVDGSGRTIFFKDAEGNLVYVDPNMANAVDNGKSGNNTAGNFEGGSGNGSGNSNNGSTGNTNNNANNGSENGSNSVNGNNLASNGTNKTRSRFNKNDKTGKTIIYTNPSHKTTNVNNYAGTNSKLGFLPAVFFTTNSADLTQTYYPQLYEIAKLLHQNPEVKIHVIGYTDKRASASYNEKLGMKRAKATSHALTAYFGVNPAQLVIESKGKVDPLTNASSIGALAANRRVQFKVDGDNTSNMKSDMSETGTSEKPVLLKSTTKTTTKAKTRKPVTKLVKETPTTTTKTKKTTTKTTTTMPEENKKSTIPEENKKSTVPEEKTKTNTDVQKTPADTSKTKKDDVFTPGNDF